MIRTELPGPDTAVATITLDRTEKRNALNIEQCEALTAAIGQCVDAGARAIVITGAAPAFCSGADLDAVYGDTFLGALYELLTAVYEVPVPVVAAINGPAIGAGLQLALACDLRVGDETARFGVPTAKLGLAVDPTTIRRLVEVGGASLARRLLLTCEVVDCDAALAAGLVDRPGTLDDARALAAEIADLAPLTLAYCKQVLNAEAMDTAGAALDDAFAGIWASEDVTEGRVARAERRPPRFAGK